MIGSLVPAACVVSVIFIMAPVSSRVINKRAAFYIANETMCIVDGEVFRNGDPVPTDDHCEKCTCRPPGFSCVLRDCEVKPGCKAVRRDGECCPEYVCGCVHSGKLYEDGELIKDIQNPCYTCRCHGSSISCVFADCLFRGDCAPEYVTGECCPRYDHCPSLDTTPAVTIFTTASTLEDNLKESLYNLTTLHLEKFTDDDSSISVEDIQTTKYDPDVDGQSTTASTPLEGRVTVRFSIEDTAPTTTSYSVSNWLLSTMKSWVPWSVEGEITASTVKDDIVTGTSSRGSSYDDPAAVHAEVTSDHDDVVATTLQTDVFEHEDDRTSSGYTNVDSGTSSTVTATSDGETPVTDESTAVHDSTSDLSPTQSHAFESNTTYEDGKYDRETSSETAYGGADGSSSVTGTYIHDEVTIDAMSTRIPLVDDEVSSSSTTASESDYTSVNYVFGDEQNCSEAVGFVSSTSATAASEETPSSTSDTLDNTNPSERTSVSATGYSTEGISLTEKAQTVTENHSPEKITEETIEPKVVYVTLVGITNREVQTHTVPTTGTDNLITEEVQNKDQSEFDKTVPITTKHEESGAVSTLSPDRISESTEIGSDGTTRESSTSASTRILHSTESTASYETFVPRDTTLTKQNNEPFRTSRLSETPTVTTEIVIDNSTSTEASSSTAFTSLSSSSNSTESTSSSPRIAMNTFTSSAVSFTDETTASQETTELDFSVKASDAPTSLFNNTNDVDTFTEGPEWVPATSTEKDQILTGNSMTVASEIPSDSNIADETTSVQASAAADEDHFEKTRESTIGYSLAMGDASETSRPITVEETPFDSLTQTNQTTVEQSIDLVHDESSTATERTEYQTTSAADRTMFGSFAPTAEAIHDTFTDFTTAEEETAEISSTTRNPAEDSTNVDDKFVLEHRGSTIKTTGSESTTVLEPVVGKDMDKFTSTVTETEKESIYHTTTKDEMQSISADDAEFASTDARAYPIDAATAEQETLSESDMGFDPSHFTSHTDSIEDATLTFAKEKRRSTSVHNTEPTSIPVAFQTDPSNSTDATTFDTTTSTEETNSVTAASMEDDRINFTMRKNTQTITDDSEFDTVAYTPNGNIFSPDVSELSDHSEFNNDTTDQSKTTDSDDSMEIYTTAFADENETDMKSEISSTDNPSTSEITGYTIPIISSEDGVSRDKIPITENTSSSALESDNRGSFTIGTKSNFDAFTSDGISTEASFEERDELKFAETNNVTTSVVMLADQSPTSIKRDDVNASTFATGIGEIGGAESDGETKKESSIDGKGTTTYSSRPFGEENFNELSSESVEESNFTFGAGSWETGTGKLEIHGMGASDTHGSVGSVFNDGTNETTTVLAEIKSDHPPHVNDESAEFLEAEFTRPVTSADGDDYKFASTKDTKPTLVNDYESEGIVSTEEEPFSSAFTKGRNTSVFISSEELNNSGAISSEAAKLLTKVTETEPQNTGHEEEATRVTNVGKESGSDSSTLIFQEDTPSQNGFTLTEEATSSTSSRSDMTQSAVVIPEIKGDSASEFPGEPFQTFSISTNGLETESFISHNQTELPLSTPAQEDTVAAKITESTADESFSQKSSESESLNEIKPHDDLRITEQIVNFLGHNETGVTDPSALSKLTPVSDDSSEVETMAEVSNNKTMTWQSASEKIELFGTAETWQNSQVTQVDSNEHSQSSTETKMFLHPVHGSEAGITVSSESSKFSEATSPELVEVEDAESFEERHSTNPAKDDYFLTEAEKTASSIRTDETTTLTPVRITLSSTGNLPGPTILLPKDAEETEESQSATTSVDGTISTIQRTTPKFHGTKTAQRTDSLTSTIITNAPLNSEGKGDGVEVGDVTEEESKTSTNKLEEFFTLDPTSLLAKDEAPEEPTFVEGSEGIIGINIGTMTVRATTQKFEEDANGVAGNSAHKVISNADSDISNTSNTGISGSEDRTSEITTPLKFDTSERKEHHVITSASVQIVKGNFNSTEQGANASSADLTSHGEKMLGDTEENLDFISIIKEEKDDMVRSGASNNFDSAETEKPEIPLYEDEATGSSHLVSRVHSVDATLSSFTPETTKSLFQQGDSSVNGIRAQLQNEVSTFSAKDTTVAQPHTSEGFGNESSEQSNQESKEGTETLVEKTINITSEYGIAEEPNESIVLASAEGNSGTDADSFEAEILPHRAAVRDQETGSDGYAESVDEVVSRTDQSNYDIRLTNEHRPVFPTENELSSEDSLEGGKTSTAASGQELLAVSQGEAGMSTTLVVSVSESGAQTASDSGVDSASQYSESDRLEGTPSDMQTPNELQKQGNHSEDSTTLISAISSTTYNLADIGKSFINILTEGSKTFMRNENFSIGEDDKEKYNIYATANDNSETSAFEYETTVTDISHPPEVGEDDSSEDVSSFSDATASIANNDNERVSYLMGNPYVWYGMDNDFKSNTSDYKNKSVSEDSKRDLFENVANVGQLSGSIGENEMTEEPELQSADDKNENSLNITDKSSDAITTTTNAKEELWKYIKNSGGSSKDSASLTKMDEVENTDERSFVDGAPSSGNSTADIGTDLNANTQTVTNVPGQESGYANVDIAEKDNYRYYDLAEAESRENPPSGRKPFENPLSFSVLAAEQAVDATLRGESKDASPVTKAEMNPKPEAKLTVATKSWEDLDSIKVSPYFTGSENLYQQMSKITSIGKENDAPVTFQESMGNQYSKATTITPRASAFTQSVFAGSEIESIGVTSGHVGSTIGDFPKVVFADESDEVVLETKTEEAFDYHNPVVYESEAKSPSMVTSTTLQTTTTPPLTVDDNLKPKVALLDEVSDIKGTPNVAIGVSKTTFADNITSQFGTVNGLLNDTDGASHTHIEENDQSHKTSAEGNESTVRPDNSHSSNHHVSVNNSQQESREVDKVGHVITGSVIFKSQPIVFSAKTNPVVSSKSFQPEMSVVPGTELDQSTQERSSNTLATIVPPNTPEKLLAINKEADSVDNAGDPKTETTDSENASNNHVSKGVVRIKPPEPPIVGNIGLSSLKNRFLPSVTTPLPLPLLLTEIAEKGEKRASSHVSETGSDISTPGTDLKDASIVEAGKLERSSNSDNDKFRGLLAEIDSLSSEPEKGDNTTNINGTAAATTSKWNGNGDKYEEKEESIALVISSNNTSDYSTTRNTNAKTTSHATLHKQQNNIPLIEGFAVRSDDFYAITSSLIIVKNKDKETSQSSSVKTDPSTDTTQESHSTKSSDSQNDEKTANVVILSTQGLSGGDGSSAVDGYSTTETQEALDSVTETGRTDTRSRMR